LSKLRLYTFVNFRKLWAWTISLQPCPMTPLP
jgi:hypothetical protein